jgi:ribose transport system substrate-binding protein
MRSRGSIRATVAAGSALLVAIAGSGAVSAQAGAFGPDAIDEFTPRCGGEETLQAAFFMNTLTNTFTVAEIDGAQQAATDCNLDLNVFDAGFDTATQVTQIEDAITAGGYSLFVIQAVDAIPLEDVVNQALEAGIAVSVPNTPIGSAEDRYPDTVTFVGHKELNVGRQAGEMALQALGEECGNLVIITGVAEMQMSQNRSAGFREVVEANENCTVVAEQPGDFDEGTAVTVMENILQAQEVVDVVFAHSDNMTSGAVTAAEAAGRADDIVFLGTGASEQGISLIADGKMYGTIYFRPFVQGQLATVLGAAFVRGVPIDEIEPFYNDSGDAIIDQTNVGEFEAEW